MAQSLSNLDHSGGTAPKKQIFKTTTASPSLKPSLQPTTMAAAQSIKSREWTANAGEFSGVFTQHTPPSLGENQHEKPQDDSFGEFHSTPLVHPGGGTMAASTAPAPGGGTLPSPSSSFSSITQPLTTHSTYTLPQGGVDHGTLPSFHRELRANQGLLAKVVPTSAYSMPITATSVSSPSLLSTGDSSHAMLSQGTRSSPVSFLAPPPGSAYVPGETQSSSQSQPGWTPGETGSNASSVSVGRVATPPIPQPIRARSPGSFGQLDASRFPPVYHEVLRRCVVSGDGYVSTKELFPILISSQLPRNVLKDLWTVANRSIPGKLNKTEVFVLLGLVALAQVGRCKSRPPPPAPDHDHTK